MTKRSGLTPRAATSRKHNMPHVQWRGGDPWAVSAFLTQRFLRRRARLVGSPCWECARCGGHQGEHGTRSPRFCEFGCDDAELDRYQGAKPIHQFRERAARYAAAKGEG